MYVCVCVVPIAWKKERIRKAIFAPSKYVVLWIGSICGKLARGTFCFRSMQCVCEGPCYYMFYYVLAHSPMESTQQSTYSRRVYLHILVYTRIYGICNNQQLYSASARWRIIKSSLIHSENVEGNFFYKKLFNEVPCTAIATNFCPQ